MEELKDKDRELGVCNKTNKFSARSPTTDETKERTARLRRAETMEMALKIHGGTPEAAEKGKGAVNNSW